MIRSPLTKLIDLPPFIVDGNCAHNMIAAVCHRVGCEMPSAGEVRQSGLGGPNSVQRDFVDFAKQFILKHVPCMDPKDVKSFKEWMDSSNYAGGRKRQLEAVKNETSELTQTDTECKSFIKFETYCEPKHARGINAHSDASKVGLGPYVQCMDKAIYESRDPDTQEKWFVKGTNPREWPERMGRIFGSGPVKETDFSSMEAHHRGVFNDVVYFAYMHVSRGELTHKYRRVLAQMIRGVNVAKFKHITAKWNQRLCSGALWTSSSNGILNLVLMAYICARSKFPQMPVSQLVAHPSKYFVGLVEGDDGIFSDVNIDESLFVSLGIKLKFDTAPQFGEAAFCGITCAQGHAQLVVDPLKILRTFFVLPAKYIDAKQSKIQGLLKSKAMCYESYLKHHPIIGELLYKVRRETDAVQCVEDSAVMGFYKYDQLRLTKADEKADPSVRFERPNPDMVVREMLARTHGISVAEQWELEKAIRSSPGCRIELDLGFYQKRYDLDHSIRFLQYRGDKYVPTPTQFTYVDDIYREGYLAKSSRKQQRVVMPDVALTYSTSVPVD